MKLLCFPYAGAASSAFLKWKKYFKGIEIIPVGLSGRGNRMTEPLQNTIEEMIDDIKKQMPSLVDKGEEYAVYGHSMGSLLIYELLHELLEKGFHLPEHVFLSGKNPPHIAIENSIHKFDDAEFIQKVIEMGGTEIRLFDNPVLTKMFLPILRTDLSIVETYRHKEKKQKLPVNISFFFSSDDHWVDSQYVKQWENYITGSFRVYNFEGRHFFIFEQEEKITNIIQETLSCMHDSIPY